MSLFVTPPPCPIDNQQYDKRATPYPFAYIETPRTDVTKHSSTSPQCPTTKPTVHRNNDHSTTRQRQETQAHKTTAPHNKDHSTARQLHQRRRPTATATTTTTTNGERQRQRQRQRHTTPPAPAPALGSPLRGDRSPSANSPSALAEWERCLTTLQRRLRKLGDAEVSSATRPQPFRLRSAGAGAATTARPQRPPQPHPQRQRKTTEDDTNGTENEKERHLKRTRTTLTEQKTGATPQFSALSPKTPTNHSKTKEAASRLTPSRCLSRKTDFSRRRIITPSLPAPRQVPPTRSWVFGGQVGKRGVTLWKLTR